MGYRVGPVRASNFGPFEDVRFDFSAPGLTCIEGMYVGHGCDDNGSGKSYLIEAVTWCVFGVLLRPRVADDDVIRLLFRRAAGQLEVLRDAKGRPARPRQGCRVEVHLVGGPKPVKIVRYRGHPSLGNRVELYVSGKNVTQGRDAMTQGAIEQLVGLDHRAFVYSVAFGASDDARSFFSATDSGRKAIMERILGLEVYAQAEKVARARHRVRSEESAEAQSKLDVLCETLTAQQRILAEVVSEEELIDKRWMLRVTQTSVQCLVNYRGQMVRRADKTRSLLTQAKADADRARDQVEREMLAYYSKRSELQRAISAAENELASNAADLRTLKGQIEKWDALAGKRCATCRQVLARERARALRKKVVREWKRLTLVREEMQPALRALHMALDELREPEEIDLSEPERLRSAWRQRKSALSDYDARIKREKAHASDLERDLAQSQRRTAHVAKEVERTRSGVRRLKDDIATFDAEIAILDFLVLAFGNGGIKSFLIESEIPRINRIATQYAQRLLGPGTRVRLSATRVLKGGGEREEMTVHAAIPGCTISYANASKGQKKRLDLCLLLAFRDTVSSRNAKAFEQFFADELFDGLDETGEDYVIELLRELSKKCPVALVTHSARLKSIGDRVITVRHEDGVSSVEASSEAMVA